MPHTPAARVKKAISSLYDQGISFESVHACCGGCATTQLKSRGIPLVWFWETDRSSANAKRGWYRRPSEDAPFAGYLGWDELDETDMENVVDSLVAAGFEVDAPADSTKNIKVTLTVN